MSYIYTDHFKIRTSEINHLKVIHPHALIQLMQEASMQHTIGMKVSVWDMEHMKTAWVLLKMKVEIFSYPALNQSVTVKTYPSGLEGYFTYRDYLMYDQDNNLIATASSMWTMMHIESRKMVKIPENFGTLVYKDIVSLAKPDKKIPSLSSADMTSTIKVNYFHLDWNGHVNNVQLIKMIMETLDSSIHVHKSLKSLNIQYKNEVLCGQILIIKSQTIAANHIIHSISAQDSSKEIVTAESFWDCIDG